MAAVHSSIPLVNLNLAQRNAVTQSVNSFGSRSQVEHLHFGNVATTGNNTVSEDQSAFLDNATLRHTTLTALTSTTITSLPSQNLNLFDRSWSSIRRLCLTIRTWISSLSLSGTVRDSASQNSSLFKRTWVFVRNACLTICALIAGWMTFSLAAWTAAKDWKLYCDDSKKDHPSALTRECTEAVNSDLLAPPWIGGWLSKSNLNVTKRDNLADTAKAGFSHTRISLLFPIALLSLFILSCYHSCQLWQARRRRTSSNTLQLTNEVASSASLWASNSAPRNAPTSTSSQFLESVRYADVRHRFVSNTKCHESDTDGVGTTWEPAIATGIRDDITEIVSESASVTSTEDDTEIRWDFESVINVNGLGAYELNEARPEVQSIESSTKQLASEISGRSVKNDSVQGDTARRSGSVNGGDSKVIEHDTSSKRQRFRLRSLSLPLSSVKLSGPKPGEYDDRRKARRSSIFSSRNTPDGSRDDYNNLLYSW